MRIPPTRVRRVVDADEVGRNGLLLADDGDVHDDFQRVLNGITSSEYDAD